MGTTLAQRLHEALNRDPLRRKLLIVNRHADGLQLLERISRQYGPVLNTNVETPESIARKQAEFGVFAAGLRFAEQADAFWIVQRAMGELSAELRDPYVSAGMVTPGVVRSFHQAVQELRSAGLTAETLRPEAFENARKGAYVQALLRRYEQALAARGLVDLAGALPYVRALTVPTELILLPHVQASWAEKQALDRLGPDEIALLMPETAFTDPFGSFPAVGARLYHATGALAEVREAFRRISRDGTPVDQVELIASDYAAYVQAVHTQAELYGIPCTYSGGLPIDYAVVGRAARLLLDWIESNYRLDRLTVGFVHGWLRAEGGSRSKQLRLLDASGIGWGRERYAEWTARNRDGGSEEAQALCGFFDAAFGALPDGPLWSPQAVMRGIAAVLDAYAPRPSEDEAGVFAALADASDALEASEAPPMEPLLAVRYVRDALDRVSYRASARPKPGHLHVSSLQDGGWSGRASTYVVGMSEQAWSLTAAQDAVLLDEEREAISPALPLVRELVKERYDERISRFGMIEGACTLSFSSFDLTDNKEVHPAYELLQVYRNKAGQPDADFEALMRGMDAVHGYASPSNPLPLDEADAWLAALVTERYRIRSGAAAVLRAYSHLAEGEAAAAARAADRLGEYEGMIDTSAYPISYGKDAEEHLSVSKLELFALCPLYFYYSHVLGIRRQDKAEFDRSRWLDPMQRGRLLHEVFQHYYEQLPKEAPHDRELLSRVTERTLEKYVAEVPAPSRHILEKECASIRADVDIFYRTEEELGTRPAYMELPLHSEEEPLAVELGGELAIPVKGIVDRIDEIAPHEYRIYDYKTGTPRKYKQRVYFAGGTQLQHALYAVAVEQWMKRHGVDEEAKVAESAYYFPTEKGLGEVVTRVQDRPEQLRAVIGNMIEAMGDGLFPPTHNPQICAWCDYRKACGSIAAQSLNKRELPDNRERLRTIEEVIAHE